MCPMQVMVAGSEPTGEYRVQYYVPAYLLKGNPQPVISTVSTTKLTYNKAFTVSYTLRNDTLKRWVGSLTTCTPSTNQLPFMERSPWGLGRVQVD